MCLELCLVRWFDCVTASDRATARKFLRDEFANAQKRDRLDLIKHLQKMQRREKWKMRNNKGGFSDDDSDGTVITTITTMHRWNQLH